MYSTKYGAIAQLGERLHGMQEVRGSIPLGSTKITNFSFYNDQLETELSENEDFNMDDFQQTIPNPWIITEKSYS